MARRILYQHPARARCDRSLDLARARDFEQGKKSSGLVGRNPRGSWLGLFDLRTDRIIAARILPPVGHDYADRRGFSPCTFLDHRSENFASYVASRALSFTNLFRREPADLFALWRPGRDTVLSAVEFDSGPALRPDC